MECPIDGLPVAPFPWARCPLGHRVGCKNVLLRMLGYVILGLLLTGIAWLCNEIKQH
jgi:hypothetical protein